MRIEEGEGLLRMGSAEAIEDEFHAVIREVLVRIPAGEIVSRFRVSAGPVAEGGFTQFVAQFGFVDSGGCAEGSFSIDAGPLRDEAVVFHVPLAAWRHEGDGSKLPAAVLRCQVAREIAFVVWCAIVRGALAFAGKGLLCGPRGSRDHQASQRLHRRETRRRPDRFPFSARCARPVGSRDGCQPETASQKSRSGKGKAHRFPGIGSRSRHRTP